MLSSPAWYWCGGGTGALVIVALIAAALYLRGKRRVPIELLGMEQLLAYAARFFKKNPEVGALAFVLFERSQLPKEVERLKIPQDTRYVVLAGVPAADGESVERWTGVLLCRQVDSAVSAVLGEKAYIVER